MASLLWTGVFIFTMLELIFTLILIVPVPQKWRNKICREVSKLDLKERFKIPLLFVGVGLAFAWMDSYNMLQLIIDIQREEHEESMAIARSRRGGWFSSTYRMTEEERMHHILEKETEYRTERNLYLVGFALTLLFVIGRITDLMQEHADLEDELETARLTGTPAVDTTNYSSSSITGGAGGAASSSSSSNNNNNNNGVEIEMKTFRSDKKDD